MDSRADRESGSACTEDAERARSLFSPWAAQLDAVRAEPMWRIAGGFDALQRWVSKGSPAKNRNLALPAL